MSILTAHGGLSLSRFLFQRRSFADWLGIVRSHQVSFPDWFPSCLFSISVRTSGSGMDGKRPQFGNRHLNDPSKVFQHNAWDNVQWSEEQEAAARKKVEENCGQPLPPEKQEEYENKASSFWNGFYTVHENRFFKDRHWLFTEFPELSSHSNGHPCADSGNGDAMKGNGCPKQNEGEEEGDPYPGASATYRIMEVGCGVGNTVFPILQNNIDPGLFVYCCDFSSTAVDLVKSNEHYDPSRCFAFVHDVSNEHCPFPVPEHSLDVIVLIFVLSAICPEKMQSVISRLGRLLKPGGCILLRDYGRYDMAQLRFKKDDLDTLLTSTGLQKVQNTVDRRLQVNRGKQLTMYRVWIQCKYIKPFSTEQQNIV
ncbi:hypothetical protein GDO86_014465 [Hymenochirus boettgeri]|uniref:tRNA N(3)-cytidine methyltransferase n=1 Tax=Hymenochirus boettgeri TaxID=247094 RepID=A0A8T2JP02_9PIPI|nr:hypothetical protein GDO86_014465 [Hymenochirus boettgeri]